MEFLCRLPHLRSLYVRDNPFVSTARGCRKTLVARIPSLAYLDDRPVFGAERSAAEAWCRISPTSFPVSPSKQDVIEKFLGTSTIAQVLAEVAQCFYFGLSHTEHQMIAAPVQKLQCRKLQLRALSNCFEP